MSYVYRMQRDTEIGVCVASIRPILTVCEEKGEKEDVHIYAYIYYVVSLRLNNEQPRFLLIPYIYTR